MNKVLQIVLFLVLAFAISAEVVEQKENNYFKCVTGCLKKKLGPSKWAELVKKCKTNVKCYIKSAGLTGLRCAGSCIKAEQKVENNYFKCVTDCIKKKLGPSKWAALVKKCKTNVKCYIKSAGLTGLRCAGSCIKAEQKVEKVENNYFKCVTDCIKKKLGPSKWAELVKKCKTDVKCYIKSAGLTGLRCAGSCIKAEKQSNVAPQNKWQKIKCIVKCLKGRVSRDRLKKVFAKCKFQAGCWKQAALKQYWGCRKVCDKTVQPVQIAKVDKLKCMQDCLKKKLGPKKWEEIYNKCKKDIKCYLKEAGFAGVACGFECLSKKVETVEEPKNPRCVMKCLVKKLGADKVKEIFKKCKRDFKCWAKETGEVGKQCVKECKKPEIKIVEVENRFLKCVGDCLKKKLGPSKWEEIYNKCKKNVKCYIKEAGFTGLKCGIECA